MIRRWRDHDNERPYDPPEPNIVRLLPGDEVQARKPTDHREPDLSDAILHDQETDAIGRYGPLAAYRLAARGYGPEFAAGWSTFVKQQNQWHRLLEFYRREYIAGRGVG